MLPTKKVNDLTIKSPPKFGAGDKGDDILPFKYATTAIIAGTRSGKTNVIFNMLKYWLSNRGERDKTTVIIIASRHKYDPLWGEIKAWLEKKKVPYLAYLDIKDNGEGENTITEFVNHLNEKAVEETPDDQYILILDDQGEELRNQQLGWLVRGARQFRIKTIISTQYPNDISKGARKQIQVWLLFHGHDIDKLKQLHTDMALSIPFEKFVELYEDATKEKYSFLYVDRDNNKFRKKFDQEYRL
jgi:hypothetical protein